MYKLKKAKGHNQTLYLENLDTKATLAVGKLSLDIVNILTDDMGLTFSDGRSYTEELNVDVTPEIASKISGTAMKTSKTPKAKTTRDTAPKNKPNKKVDAMDVLLGIASYTKTEKEEM